MRGLTREGWAKTGWRTRRIAASLLGVGAVIAGAAPAVAASADSDATTGFVSAGNGVAGVEQRVDVVAPGLANTTVEVVAYSNRGSDVAYANLNAKGQGSAVIVPTAAGSWTVAASGDGLSLKESVIRVEAVPTISYVYVPNKAQRFVPMGLIASVHTSEGSAPVSGTVTFYEASLGRLGEVKVESQEGQAHAVANLTWTPPDAGTFAFHTVFEPAVDQETGTPALEASVSGTGYLPVVTHPVAVQLLMPPVMRIGRPAFVIAQLPDIYRGTVSLLVDGRAVSPDKETAGGLATFEWLPVHTGLTDVQLELQNERHPRLERLVTQTVDVQPRLVPNPISVSPVINGVAGPPWADDDVLDYPAGTRVTLVMSTGNGAGVVVSQRGRCLLNGTTLVVPSGGGGCRVTFSSPGDAVFATNSAEVLITSSVDSGRSPGRRG